MAKCPKCGKDNRVPATAWAGGARTKRLMIVKRFVCSECGTSYVVWQDSTTGEVKTMARKKRA